MANERNSLKAGLFILASIVLIIAVIIGIKGVGRFLEPMQQASVRFTLADDVGGLSPGDEVRIGGAKVGIVRGIEFVNDPDGKPAISVRFTLPERFAVHKDAVVAIQSTVTGVSVLNFTSLGSGERLAAGESLTGKPSALSELFNAVPEVMAVVRDVRTVTLPKVNSGIDQAVGTVGTYRKTAETATEFLTHLRAKVDPIADRYYAMADAAKDALSQVSALFGDTKADFRTTVANLRDATGTVKTKLPGMMDKMDALLTKVTTAVESTNEALEDVKQIASNTRDVSQSARQLVTGNRGKIDSMIASLKTTGDNLKAASSEIRHRPWRLLYKPGSGEVANLNLYDSAREFAEGAGQLNDAAIALRDALKDPDVEKETVAQLVERLDRTFAGFNEVEKRLWNQVQVPD